MLQQELPGLTGFSETNIKNMRIFYEAWSPVLNRQMASADLDNVLDIRLLLNRQLTAADMNEDDLESFSDTSKPMGVATYRTSKELPPEIRQALPDMEDLKKLIVE